MEKDNVKSQKERNDRKSDTAHNGGSVRMPQPISIHLTCNEAQLEVLMSEGEST
jgi:hypothetical protein